MTDDHVVADVRAGSRAHTDPPADAGHSELPHWVWELLIELQRVEAEHGKLFVDTYRGYVRWDWCPMVALSVVPVSVLVQAEAIGSYLRSRPAPVGEDLDTSTFVDLSAAAREAAADVGPSVRDLREAGDPWPELIAKGWLEDVAAAFAAIGEAEQRYREVLRAALACGVKQVDVSKRLGRSDEMLRQDAMTDEERAAFRDRDAARKRGA